MGTMDPENMSSLRHLQVVERKIDSIVAKSLLVFDQIPIVIWWQGEVFVDPTLRPWISEMVHGNHVFSS